MFIVISSYLAAGSDKMRYTTEGSQHILTADQRQFYEDNGFLVIRRLVSQDKLDTFYERFKQVCKKEVKVSTCRYITIKHASVTSCNVTKCNAIDAIMLQKCFNILWFYKRGRKPDSLGF